VYDRCKASAPNPPANYNDESRLGSATPSDSKTLIVNRVTEFRLAAASGGRRAQLFRCSPSMCRCSPRVLSLSADLSPPVPRQTVPGVQNFEADIDVLHGAWFAVPNGEAASRAFTVKPVVAWLTTTPDAGSDRVAWAGTGADLTNDPRPACVIAPAWAGGISTFRVPRTRFPSGY